jgi:hypothetical protein
MATGSTENNLNALIGSYFLYCNFLRIAIAVLAYRESNIY